MKSKKILSEEARETLKQACRRAKNSSTVAYIDMHYTNIEKMLAAITASEAENERLIDGLKELEDLVPQNTRLSEIIQNLLTPTK